MIGWCTCVCVCVSRTPSHSKCEGSIWLTSHWFSGRSLPWSAHSCPKRSNRGSASSPCHILISKLILISTFHIFISKLFIAQSSHASIHLQIHLHGPDFQDTLSDFFSAAVLPLEYSGEGLSVEEACQDWTYELLRAESLLLQIASHPTGDAADVTPPGDCLISQEMKTWNIMPAGGVMTFGKPATVFVFCFCRCYRLNYVDDIVN